MHAAWLAHHGVPALAANSVPPPVCHHRHNIRTYTGWKQLCFHQSFCRSAGVWCMSPLLGHPICLSAAPHSTTARCRGGLNSHSQVLGIQTSSSSSGPHAASDCNMSRAGSLQGTASPAALYIHILRRRACQLPLPALIRHSRCPGQASRCSTLPSAAHREETQAQQEQHHGQTPTENRFDKALLSHAIARLRQGVCVTRCGSRQCHDLLNWWQWAVQMPLSQLNSPCLCRSPRLGWWTWWKASVHPCC